MSYWRVLGLICIILMWVELFTHFISKQFGSNSIVINCLIGAVMLFEAAHSNKNGYISLRRKRIHKIEHPKSYTCWLFFLLIGGLAIISTSLYVWLNKAF